MAELTVLNNAESPRLGAISGSGGPIGDPERERLAEDLRRLLADAPGSEVRFGRHDRMLYATDASLYQVEPTGVVVPGGIDAAERLVRFCGERDVAMLPRGGGTSLAGQSTNRAVVIDLTPRCRAVRWVDIGLRRCEVEPGIAVDELNDHLAAGKTGLFFAPDPATTRQAAVGGCVGNNAAGARSVRYGRTSENIDRLEVCLATGERLWLGPDAGRGNQTARRLGEGVLRVVRAHGAAIRERFPRTIRRNAGYGLDMILDQADRGATAESVDLAKLLCGSEGTLAVTMGAVLKLHPVPRTKGLAVVSFRTLEDAIEATKPILDACLPLGLTAVELLDDVVLDAARGNIEYRRYVDLLPGADASRGEPKAALYVEFFGFESGGGEVEQGFAALRALMATTPGVIEGGIACYTDSAAMLKAWALRKAGEPLLHGLPGARKPITFVEDNAVPVERLGEFVREFKKIVGRHGTRAAYWAHASVGVLHVRPMVDLHDPADRERMRAIAVEVADLARACGGIMSGEHGDGRVRGPLLERFFGPALMRAFREVKALFDPRGLLNPGNLVAPGPIASIAEQLRVDAEGVTDRRDGADGKRPFTAETYFDYSDVGGFVHAVEQCNGAGVCRKRAGLMCPSYQATLDERHSTRGRGNALRLAVTGQFAGLEGLSGEPDWSDPETIATLDLCLSCKACKSECPSNVDIARLKAEYTAQRFRRAGRVPLGTLAVGHVRWLNRFGSAAPGLANAVGRTRAARAVIDRVMGLDPRRSLPPFTRSLFARARSMPLGQDGPGAPRVVLYGDCFTAYNESHIGVAAAGLLHALGYAVEVVDAGCCGRSMISVGMLERAAATIDATVGRLWKVAADPSVVGIVVCEPSCLSAIKDDWLGLRLRSDGAVRRAIAAKSSLVEEFVDRRWEAHPNRSLVARLDSAKREGPEVLLHGHCHQKSLWGVQTSAALLKRLVGERCRVLDTGCCGMAGSFGYDRRRYGLSMRIGELSLFPAVRGAPADALIVTPGTSCRHQVHDGTGRRALHPVELAAKVVEGVMGPEDPAP